MVTSTKFLPGDICTHNRFECRVVENENESGKVKIAFAVFVNGDRIFDENDTKLVPPNRLVLVRREWQKSFIANMRMNADEDSPSTPCGGKSLEPGITPSFSQRRKAITAPQSSDEHEGHESLERSVKQLTSPKRKKGQSRRSIGSENRPPRDSNANKEKRTSEPRKPSQKKRISLVESPASAESVHVIKSKRKSRKRRSVADTPIPIVPDSFVDSYVSSGSSGSSGSSDSSQSSSGSSRSPQTRRRRRNQSSTAISVADTPIPIVSDGYMSSSDASPVSLASADSYSQERERMRSLALMYEERAGRDRKSDEVVFAWDDGKKKVKPLSLIPGLRRQSRPLSFASSFIVQDTPPLPPPAAPAKTVADLPAEFPEEALRTAEKPVEIFKAIWKYIDDSVSVVGEHVAAIEWLKETVTVMSVVCSASTATELRVAVTQSGFLLKSVLAWIAAIATVALVTARFKPVLLPDFMQKVSDKIGQKFELQCAYIIAVFRSKIRLPDDKLVSTVGIGRLLQRFEIEGPEGRALLEELIGALMENCHEGVGQLLPVLAGVLGTFSPAPVDIVPSLTVRLVSEFATNLATFMGQSLPNIHYLPLLVKGGGFLPLTDPGDQKFDFGKFRGLPFKQVLRDKGFCDWTERQPDPSSVAFVEWLDYVLWFRSFCVVGRRTVKADVEFLRIAGQKDKVTGWMRNRALVAQRCVDFYTAVGPQATEMLSYAVCVHNVFAFCVGDDTGVISDTPTRPRAEVVKEIFRPLLKLGQTFPDLKSIISNAIVQARAVSHSVSCEEARAELKNFHSLLL